jgi:hypothetical protein
MRRVSQEVQVWELAVGSAMRVLVHDGVANYVLKRDVRAFVAAPLAAVA